jgi:pyrimidine/purine-5'-nucleotide nucleosidase
MPLTPEQRHFNQQIRHLEHGRLDLFEGVLARGRNQAIEPLWQSPVPWSGLPLETATELRQQRLRLWQAAAQAAERTTLARLVEAHPCLDLEPEHRMQELDITLRCRPLAVADWILGRPGMKAAVQKQDNPRYNWLSSASQRRDVDAIQWVWAQKDLPPLQDKPTRPVMLTVVHMAQFEPQMPALLAFLVQQKVPPTQATQGSFAGVSPLSQLVCAYISWRQNASTPSAVRDAHQDAMLMQVWPLLVNAGDDPACAVDLTPETPAHWRSCRSTALRPFLCMSDLAPVSASRPTVNARIHPTGGLDILSRNEVASLRSSTNGGQHALLRRCALAVLTSGDLTDDPQTMFERYPDFDIQVLQQDRGIKIELRNAPAQAFVDGQLIKGINELLVAIVRDIVYMSNQMSRFDLDDPIGITHAVFEVLRNARVLRPNMDPNLVVCWGGHSISTEEYEYTKRVGYQLGLRGLDICTGCGPGAMKGPMKGATIAHAKQRRTKNRYLGVTEPGIIAAESPNPIVNQLVVLPDIEKRLEAFVRMGHGFLVFPGGAGTAEEILFLLGVLLHPKNEGLPFPLVLTGPIESKPYFDQIDRFLRLTLGDEATQHYQIIIDDPAAVAHAMVKGLEKVRHHRLDSKDAFFFNWSLHIPFPFQKPFEPTHETMGSLVLDRSRPRHELAADLRRAFSGIVAGNVKPSGVAEIAARGPFAIRGEPEFMKALDALLQAFVAQHRMKIPGGTPYVPCYRVIT